MHNCRSREGAWIEICYKGIMRLMLEGRSREGAWIEIQLTDVAKADYESLPRGSVD